MSVPHTIVILNAEVFAPEPLGKVDILAAHGAILAAGKDVPHLPDATVLDASGLRVIPGLIDQHTHFLGGGDGNGLLGRVPEATAEMYFAAGVTSAVGLLGVDEDTRTLRLLLRKTHELRGKGLSAWFYTGGMRRPTTHLLDSVCADVSFIDQVIGAKTAIAERLHPNTGWDDLADLAGQVMRARAMTGKAAVLHCHIGHLPEVLAPLERLIRDLDMPRSQIMPTHVNRTSAFSAVFEQALDFALQGGTIDLTCCVSRIDGNLTGVDVPDAVRACIDAGVPLERITMSSDGNIPHALRDSDGRQTGMAIVPPTVLWRDLWRLQSEGGLTLEQALRLVTTNVADFLGLGARKGRIAPGHDADLVLIDPNDRIRFVIAGGRIVYSSEG